MTAADRVAGFVGLGVMGSAMSSHLLAAGWEVAGYDVDPARLAGHGARGGITAASPAAVTERAAVVVTSLPSAQALLEVVQGDGGLAAGRTDGLVVIETSTLPAEVKEQARRCVAGCGGWLLDCTVSGTGHQARDKDIVAYLSGDEAAKRRAVPVLRDMTRGHYDVGAFGNGSKMKIIANLLVAVHNVAAAEALLVAERAGLDLPTVLAAVGDGAGTSRMFEVRGPQMAAGDYADAAVRLSVFGKDIDIIEAFARDLAVPAPLFSLSSVLYRAAMAQGRGEQDTACVHAVLRQLAGG